MQLCRCDERLDPRQLRGRQHDERDRRALDAARAPRGVPRRAPFEQIQRNTGIARNILTDRLGTLVLHGILRRELYQERPERHEYRLTEQGLDLYPVLLTVMDWGAKHADGDAITLTHKTCGATMMPRLACPECGEPVGARDIRAVREEAALGQSA